MWPVLQLQDRPEESDRRQGRTFVRGSQPPMCPRVNQHGQPGASFARCTLFLSIYSISDFLAVFNSFCMLKSSKNIAKTA